MYDKVFYINYDARSLFSSYSHKILLILYLYLKVKKDNNVKFIE